MNRSPLKHFLSKLSIKRALLFLLVLGVICPVVVFAVWLSRMTNDSLRQTEEEFARQTVQSNAKQLENTIASISYAAIYITGNREMKENAAAICNTPSSPTVPFAKEDIIKYMRSVSSAALYTLDPELSVIFPDGSVLNGEYGLRLETPERLFEQFDDGKNALWHNPYDSAPDSDLDSYWAFRQFGKLVGILHIHIPGESLWNQLTNHPILQYKQEIYNFDALICTNQTETLSEAAETTTYAHSLQRWGMTLTVTIPNSIVTEKVDRQSSLFFWFFLVLIAAMTACIWMISGRISGSIQKIVARIQRIQQGDLTQQPGPDSYEEINYLAENLNEVAARIHDLTDEAARQARLKEQMYYEALMAQINPHFLYNTLNSIKWLASINGNDAVAEMLSKLGNILHYAFHHSSDQVTIQQELAFLDNYVELLQLRFGNTVTFLKEVPNTLSGDTIPRFCIQPLIENALTHGLFSMQNGEVALEICQEGGALIITVSDNGLGMEQEKAERLLREPHPTGSFTGIGVWNVHQRIQLLYGTCYGLKITSSPNCGCSVEIKIPRQGTQSLPDAE